jgi:small subunit ribosomal protein S16
MALVIRLRKLGARHKPFFRIAVTESTSARDGRFVEEIGWYDPKRASANSKVDVERAAYWMSQGAKPSETVRSILKKHGLFGGTLVAQLEPEPEKPSARTKPQPEPEAAPEPASEPQPEPAPAEAPAAQAEPEPTPAEAPAGEPAVQAETEPTPGDQEKQE